MAPLPVAPEVGPSAVDLLESLHLPVTRWATAALLTDAEDRMVGRDPAQFLLVRVGADAVEESANLPFPLLQVGA